MGVEANVDYTDDTTNVDETIGTSNPNEEMTSEDDTTNVSSEPPMNNTYVNPAFAGDTNPVRVVAEGEIAVVPDVDSVSSDSSLKHVYGWQCFTPNAIQRFNHPSFFLFCVCLGVIAQGLIVSGITLASLTAIEKQFGLKSSQVALFSTIYDTAYGVCSLFIGYLCTFHKPRFIGWGLVIMMFGAVLVSIPKFIIGPYTAGTDQFDDFCNNNGTVSNGDTCPPSQAWFYQLIFNLGFIIMGFGATPLYTLGPAHIDEVTSISKSSVYLGIFYAAAATGPAIGFITAMPVLDTWIELNNPPHSLTPLDPNWVGAWWLGFLIGAGLLLVPVIPMLGLPRLFPDTDELRTKKRATPDYVPKNHELKLGWPAMKALLQNPSYMFITLAISAESLAIGGFSTFIPKFVETQFNFTASKAALYTGIMGIPGAAGGVLLGGYLVYKFEWNCKQILKRASISALIATLLSAFILVGCNTYDKETTIKRQDFIFNATCNVNCNCNTRYRPICSDKDEKTYFSPCNAGCSAENKINNTYHNCACFPPNITMAVNGKCRAEDCLLFPLFVVGIFFVVVFSFLNNVPLINATFRVVHDGQGSFAMGFQQIFIRFLGFIPSPVMYGALIDRSCTLWKSDKCPDKTTNCLEYNNEYFRYYMFILAITTKFLACIFMYLAYITYKLPTKAGPAESGIDNVTYTTTQRDTEPT